MNDKDPESTPFFKVALVALGVLGVFAISPMADQLSQHYINNLERERMIENMAELNKVMPGVDCGDK